MDSTLALIHHRSKDRIRDLGEVFTSKSYVDQMLTLLSNDNDHIWSDDSISFLEPCCGHGNIVITICNRRMSAFWQKAVALGIRDPAYYAVGNALNTLWAIDFDPKNVENCRSRVLSATLDFLKTKFEIKSDAILFSKKRDFFAHVLSAIKWHIDENETLSALSKSENAKTSANLTKSGAKWFSQNGHQPMDFDLSWVNFFKSCEASKTIPLEYERSVRFIDAVVLGKLRGFEDYEFAKAVIEIANPQDSTRKPSRSLSVGA